jgi:hypothetical protein
MAINKRKEAEANLKQFSLIRNSGKSRKRSKYFEETKDGRQTG